MGQTKMNGKYQRLVGSEDARHITTATYHIRQLKSLQALSLVISETYSRLIEVARSGSAV